MFTLTIGQQLLCYEIFVIFCFILLIFSLFVICFMIKNVKTKKLKNIINSSTVQSDSKRHFINEENVKNLKVILQNLKEILQIL